MTESKVLRARKTKAQEKLGRFSRRAGILAASGIFVLILLWLGFSSGGHEATAEAPERPTRTVTFVEASADRHRAEIAGLAEVKPRWSSNLRAQVGGVLTLVSDRLQPGARVAAGELLARIDRAPWSANLAEAENRLALAELQLLVEQQEAEEARVSWRQLDLAGEPESDLVLRGPQIEAALAQVEAARTARDWAARQLEHTEIRAPFAGIVAARHVSRGESVLEGEVLAQVLATEVFEVAVSISDAQWRFLEAPVVGTTAELLDPVGPGRWHARVARVDGSLDAATRMRRLYLTVRGPLDGEEPLLPGAFVQVRLAGAGVDRVLELPEGVLNRRGQIWYVDDDDTLRRFEAEALFTRPGLVYIAEPRSAAVWRIVRYPLDNLMVGQAVRPVPENTGESALADTDPRLRG